MEKTLVLIKPDAFAKHYSGDIIKRYEEEGFRIVAMKLMKMDERLASIHYAEHIDEYPSQCAQKLPNEMCELLSNGKDSVDVVWHN